VTRKKPIRHRVSGYKRKDGTRVGTYVRGSGTRPRKSGRVVSKVTPQSKLEQKMRALRDAGYMYVREWQLDDERTFGEPGYVQVSLGEYGRIGADEVVIGDLGDLFDKILSTDIGIIKEVDFAGIDYSEWHPDEFEYIKLVRKYAPKVEIKLQ